MTSRQPIDEPSLDPELVEVDMHLVPPTQPVTGIVTSNEICLRGKSASFVRHVCVDVSGTPLQGAFHAGQSFGIVPPGLTEHGKPHKVRLYSIASPTVGEDGEGRILSTTCKRLIDEHSPQVSSEEATRGLHLGVCSNYVCDLAPGDEIRITGPAGKRFVLPKAPERHDFLFLATGTGIAPFRGMVKDLLEGPDGPCKSDIHLVMGAPYTSDLLYDGFFRETADRHPNFHYHTVISREFLPDGRPQGYIHHYLDREIRLHGDLLTRDRALVYICGLAGMQTGVFQAMAKLGIGGPYLKVHEELAGVAPEDWELADIKRRVRPTHRCMLEVY
ncbi:MAG: hypothetical protein O3A19_03740 [Planctomycetota bacterium]|nr:hypothetical protein [Planctomycetota bacterium]MDA1025519.1 hypothetical protein [Planctomycetota bacterium]